MQDMRQTKEGFIKSMILFIVLLGVCFAPFLAFSQIPTRVIVNSGFESPAKGCSPASYNFIPQTSISGWKTEDSISASTVNCGASSTSAPYLTEIWTSGFGSRTAHSGSQFAEINGNNATFLYQVICLLANETVPFSVWHIKRGSSGAAAETMVAELKLNRTTTIATGATHTATTSWTNYTGTLTNNGTSGMRRYGFRAVSGGSLGNLIDDVTISLRPLVDIKAFNFSSVYESDSDYLKLYVNGTLLGPATVTITKSGTASYMSDYTIGAPSRGSASISATGNITLTLPAGDYDPNQSSGSTAGLISMKYKVLNENVAESPETVIYTITGSANGGNGNSALDLATTINGQSAACVPAVVTAQFQIIDVTSLPVKLVSFTADKEVGFNIVNWTVAEEDKLTKYLLQYSTNGNDYSTVAEVPFSATNRMNYTYAHQVADNQNASYRLMAVDMDGNVTELGHPITLSRNINTTFSVFPNPNKGFFTANFYSPRDMQTDFIVTDLVGKELFRMNVSAHKGENSVPLKVADELPSGIYYITYSYNGVTKTMRINIIR